MVHLSDDIIHILSESLDSEECDVRQQMEFMEKFSPVQCRAMLSMAMQLAQERGEKAEYRKSVRELSDAHLKKDEKIDCLNSQLKEYKDREDSVFKTKFQLDADRQQLEKDKAAFEIEQQTRRAELEQEYQLKMIQLCASISVPKEKKTLAGQLLHDVKKRVKKSNTLLSINALCSVLSGKAIDSVSSFFEQGYDMEWFNTFWTEFCKKKELVAFVFKKEKVNAEAYMMVIGKLIELKVFKDDADGLSTQFAFAGIKPDSLRRYSYKSKNSLPDDVSEWIENYLKKKMTEPIC